MANFLDLELSDYVLSHVDENDDESPLGIIEDTLVFSKKKVNPFCIIFAEDIKDKIYSCNAMEQSGHQMDYCTITTSDGNKYICKGSSFNVLRMVETAMDTSGLPF